MQVLQALYQQLAGEKNDHQRHGIRHARDPRCAGRRRNALPEFIPEIYRQGSAEVCVIARSPYGNYRRSEYQGR